MHVLVVANAPHNETQGGPIGARMMAATPMPLLFALAAAFSPLAEAFAPSASPSDTWVLPQGLPEGHNGGQRERLTAPAAGKQPHILMVLFDDYGWEGRLHTVRSRPVLSG